MFSFSALLLLFLMGLIGLGLAMFGNMPDDWILISAAVGLLAWLLALMSMWIGSTFTMVHHLKRSREIDKKLKAELSEEKKQVIQRGSSVAKKKAKTERLKLWINSLLGIRD